MKAIELSPEQKAQIELQLSVLQEGTAEIIPLVEFRQKLTRSVLSGVPLRVKLGLDPSAPDVHIGHTVVLRKLRQFQDFGHTVQLVVGDFTGRIGDPSGRSSTRRQLSDEEVMANAQTYVEQFGKVMDMEKAELHFNAAWLARLNFADVVRLASLLTVARMLEREDFGNRYREGQPIYVHEFFYPLMQGYDSVALHTDIELGGTDQTFNLLMGRTVQEAYGQERQVVMTCPLLEGLDGVRKMSKSLNNYIGVAESPGEIYGKAMSVPDELLLRYLKLATDLPRFEVDRIAEGLSRGTLHPRDAKMLLARTLTRMYYGEAEAQAAEDNFVQVFSRRETPTEMPEYTWVKDAAATLVEVLVATSLTPSNSESRRKIRSGAVRVNGEKVTDVDARLTIDDGTVVQLGRRSFVRLRLPAR